MGLGAVSSGGRAGSFLCLHRTPWGLPLARRVRGCGLSDVIRLVACLAPRCPTCQAEGAEPVTQPQAVTPPGAQTGTLDGEETGSQLRAGHIPESPTRVPGPRVGLAATSPSSLSPPPLRRSWSLVQGPRVSAICPGLVDHGTPPLSGTPALPLQRDPVSSSWRDVARGPAVRCSPGSGKARRLPRLRLQLRIRGRKQQGSGGVTGTDGTLGCPSLARESKQGERCREQSSPPALDPLMVAEHPCPPE